MFERSQRLKEQRRRLEEEKIHVEALQEVSGLPQKEIEKIACQVRSEYTSVQKAKRKKTAGLIRALIVLAIAGSLSGLLIWGRHKIPRPQTERGQTIRSARNEEELVLIEAAGDGNLQMVRFLLKKGISINAALEAAAGQGRLKAVRLLVGRATDLQAPLSQARRNGYREIEMLLLEARAAE